MLLDTNIVIYSCQPGGDWLKTWTTDPAAATASVTRIEALGYVNISAEEEAALRRMFSTGVSYEMDDEIIEQAIKLRQARKMKLGDAIIAATALEYDVPLVTRNEADFKHIIGLVLINPFSTAP